MSENNKMDMHDERGIGGGGGGRHHPHTNGSDSMEAGQLKGGAELGRQISVTLTPSQFEEMYLQPGSKSRGQTANIKAFGNPTPLGIVCFLLTYTPTMCVLMGFRGTTANSLLSLLGAYYFFGGMGMWISGILEWIVGNTFPSLVFISFGSFWLSLAIVVDPRVMVQSTLGQSGPVFNSGWGLYLIFWSIFVYFLAIAACKTNITFVIILTSVAMTFNLLGCTYFKLASNDAYASTLLIATGAVGFIASVAGYWLLLHLILASVDFPFNVPLGDLSHFYKKNDF